MSREKANRVICASSLPKTIAEIKICGALTIPIKEGSGFIEPTEEQKKNLREMLCIDVEVLDSNECP